MSYLVLARKWRPKLFEEVIGQDSVVKTLVNTITRGRIPQAILFTGMRGVGKTTAARIFAKALNCQKGPTATPCNECPNCNEISSGSSMDVLEIDGASNTGVNDIRELRENVRYLPGKSKYKIYIIDEVHMLSQSAFNALLKTLEEPPERVLFIFATTEPQNIPQTILSRVQRFDLRPIPDDKIVMKLKEVTSEEKFKISDYSLEVIAREGRGSMRDALSILDKIIGYGGDGIKDEEVIDILGLVRRELLTKASGLILAKDSKALIELVEEMFSQGYDPKIFLSGLLEYFRNLLVLKIETKSSLSNVPKEDVDEMRVMSQNASLEALQSIFDIVKNALAELPRTDYQRFIVEMAMIRSTGISALTGIDKVIEGLKKMDGGGGSDGHQREGAKAEAGLLGDEKAASGGDFLSRWADITATVKKEKPALGIILENANASFAKGILNMSFDIGTFHADKVNEPENICYLNSLLERRLSGFKRIDVHGGKTAKPIKQSPNPGRGLARGEDKNIKMVMDIMGGNLEGD